MKAVVETLVGIFVAVIKRIFLGDDDNDVYDDLFIGPFGF